MEDSAVKCGSIQSFLKFGENCHQKVGDGYICTMTCWMRDPNFPVICPNQVANRFWWPWKMSSKLTINRRRLTTHLTRHAKFKKGSAYIKPGNDTKICGKRNSKNSKKSGVKMVFCTANVATQRVRHTPNHCESGFSRLTTSFRFRNIMVKKSPI